jgi:GT2 family glycosyltransferase
MNRSEELLITLSSLKGQNTDFELIVVDNGSSDGTPEKVREFWPEAILIELNSNHGVPVGRNRGIGAATGDILVFVDDDASFESKDALTRIRKRFEKDPRLGILATNSHLASTGKPEIAAIPRRDKKILETDYQTSYFCGVGFALRRDLIKEIGDFFEGYFYSCEELDLSWRALDGGYSIVWAADIIVLHRLTPVERPQGRWIYSNAKNRVWLAARHLPWRYVISYGVLWWGFLFATSIRNLLVKDFIKGMGDCIAGLPKILKERKPLSEGTLKMIRGYNGRLIY